MYQHLKVWRHVGTLFSRNYIVSMHSQMIVWNLQSKCKFQSFSIHHIALTQVLAIHLNFLKWRNQWRGVIFNRVRVLKGCNMVPQELREEDFQKVFKDSIVKEWERDFVITLVIKCVPPKLLLPSVFLNCASFYRIYA